MGRYTGDVNDAAVTTRGHRWTEFLTWQQKSAHNIEVETRLPVSHLNLFERPLGRHSNFRIVAISGIYQHGRSARHSGDFFMSDLKVGPADRISLEESRMAAIALDFFGARLSALFITSKHGNLGACLGEAF